MRFTGTAHDPSRPIRSSACRNLAVLIRAASYNAAKPKANALNLGRDCAKI
jgi:hypothetical protein